MFLTELNYNSRYKTIMNKLLKKKPTSINASSTVEAGFVVSAVVEILVAKQSTPPLVTVARVRLVTVAENMEIVIF